MLKFLRNFSKSEESIDEIERSIKRKGRNGISNKSRDISRRESARNSLIPVPTNAVNSSSHSLESFHGKRYAGSRVKSGGKEKLEVDYLLELEYEEDTLLFVATKSEDLDGKRGEITNSFSGYVLISNDELFKFNVIEKSLEIWHEQKSRCLEPSSEEFQISVDGILDTNLFIWMFGNLEVQKKMKGSRKSMLEEKKDNGVVLSLENE